MVRRILLATAIAAVCATSLAQEAGQLAQQASQALAARDYGRAGDLLVRVFEQDPSYPAALYNAACAYALAGDTARAFATLERAVAKGYMNVAQIEKDADLRPLHAEPRWPAFIAQVRQKQALDANLFNSPALASAYRDDLPEDEKIAGLSKLWSEVKYNFVYVDTLKAIDWDKVYLDTIPLVRATRSTGEYYRVLDAMIARLKDGHTNIRPADELVAAERARPLVKTQLVENKVLVREVYDPALAADGVVPGLEITAVDGVPVREYVEREIVPYVSASTPQDLANRAYGMDFLVGKANVAPRVSFRTAAGKGFDVRLRRAPLTDYFKHAFFGKPAFEMRTLPGNVAYVALNQFGNSEAADGFMAAFDRIARSSALIIDVRANSGGNSTEGYRVLATLTDKPFLTAKWGTRQYLPTYRAWQRPMPDHEEVRAAQAPDSARRYSKPVIVLTSEATYSAAEDFAVAFDSMQRGVIVGQATGGSTGQPLVVALPGGGRARICTKRDTYPDGRAWVGVGIQPGIKVEPTVADVRSGRDTVLEAALAALRK